jgi:predicted PurR-regulated permease PerM
MISGNGVKDSIESRPEPPRQRPEDRFFLWLLAAVSALLGLLIWPFFGAILWSFVFALLFTPMDRWLRRLMHGRRNTPALLTLLAMLMVVIVPAIGLGMAILGEAVTVYERIETGRFDIGGLFLKIQSVLPDWALRQLDRMGMADIDQIRERVVGLIAGSFETIAAQALAISQSALAVLLAVGVVLYLTFFLLRDGDEIGARIEESIPLRPELRSALLDKIVAVVRATIKGSLVVAILQGLIGGVVFAMLGIGGALLWGIAMGFFSLLPAIGTAIIWVPVALFLLATGSVVQGMILVFCGLFVIGMVDNLLRPVLVGRDTQMPDYVVFISTLGGLELFGFNGFVVGPVIAALFMAVWEMFVERRRAEA